MREQYMAEGSSPVKNLKNTHTTEDRRDQHINNLLASSAANVYSSRDAAAIGSPPRRSSYGA